MGVDSFSDSFRERLKQGAWTLVTSGIPWLDRLGDGCFLISRYRQPLSSTLATIAVPSGWILAAAVCPLLTVKRRVFAVVVCFLGLVASIAYCIFLQFFLGDAIVPESAFATKAFWYTWVGAYAVAFLFGSIGMNVFVYEQDRRNAAKNKKKASAWGDGKQDTDEGTGSSE